MVYFSKQRGANAILQQETAGRFQYHNRFLFLYIALLFITASYYLFQWPIIAYDADLWYHLSNGRHIINTGAIPDSSYFSFITPPREWLNYYWLFQVLVYKVFSLSGYQGLIILRTIVYLILAALICMYLLKMESGKLTESRMYFKFAELNVPAHDVQWKKKIQDQLSRFIVD